MDDAKGRKRHQRRVAIMAVDLNELEVLAKDAWPGPWTAEWVDQGEGYGAWHVAGPDEDRAVVCMMDWQQDNATYIAAVNPRAILELIAMLREAWGEVERLRDLLARLEWAGADREYLGTFCPACQHSYLDGHGPGCDLAAELRTERP
jgi:hypothetical protein